MGIAFNGLVQRFGGRDTGAGWNDLGQKDMCIRSAFADFVDDEAQFLSHRCRALPTQQVVRAEVHQHQVSPGFDGGVHDASLLDAMVKEPREIQAAEFCTPLQVHERAADFTARRVLAAPGRHRAG